MMKKVYIKPTVDVFEIALEDAFAAGSALVQPQDSDSVQAEWELDTDVDKSFIWE